MRRERMPEDVRTQGPANVRALAVLLQDLPEADARQRPPARIDEQPRRRSALQERRASVALVALDPGRRLLPYRDGPLLVPLADARAVMPIEVKVGQANATQ